MSLNLAWIVERSAARYPEAPAIRFRGRTWTHAELREAVRRTANALRGLGVRPGDKVALLLPNLPEFTVAYFGILHLGASVVPLNTLFVGGEVAYHLQDSDAVALIAWSGMEEVARAGMEQAPGCRTLILLSYDADFRPTGAESFYDLLHRASADADLAQTRPDDSAVLLYTSGTTGRPKGAELTHFNLYTNSQWCSERSRSRVPEEMVIMGPGCVGLAALPLFHSFGQVCVQNCMLFNGGAFVPMARWDAEEAIRTMAAEGINLFAGVPTMYFALLQAADTLGGALPHLRFCSSGGAPMPVEVMRQFDERFDAVVMEGYGLSETSPVATFHTPEFPRKPGTVGKAIDLCEVRVVDDQDQPVAAGQVGEVVIRGQNIMRGYYKKPEATAEAMKGGWFHSGDLGTLDDEGYVAIVDRKKDMILRGGFNVYPRELEETLYAHPSIAEAAVVGVPCPEKGEEIVAVIALKPGAALTAKELTAYCRKHMAAYKYPRYIEFRDSLPKGGTGKILKRALREEMRGKHGKG